MLDEKNTCKEHWYNETDKGMSRYFQKSLV